MDLDIFSFLENFEVKLIVEYKQIKPKKIYEEVAETILSWIKNGELNPGDKLDSVHQLAEKFQVGRAAIREALSALRAMGLIEMKQGEGTYVKKFDPSMVTFPISAVMNSKDIFHLLEVRKILEAGSAYASAQKRTQNDLTKMDKALNRMNKMLDDQNLGEEADIDFHLAIANATQNPILINLMNSVSEMMIENMRETRRLILFSKPENSEQLYQQHVEILMAIKNKEHDLARQIMINHLQFVENLLSAENEH